MGELNIHSRTMQPNVKRLNSEGLLFHEDLMMDILSRLPVKSLIWFKLVSKSFNSLISNTYFVKLHLCRSSAPNANPRIIFEVPLGVIENIEYLHVKTFLKTPPSIEKELQPLRATWEGPHLGLGSCNGLIYVTGFVVDHSNSHEQDFWVILWNPATRETSRQSFTLHTKRAYDKSILYNYCGFGYDHVSDTYKVMKVVEEAVFVFNMNDGNGRKVGYFPPDLITLEKNRPRIVGVLLNGALNWLVTSKINEEKLWSNNNENSIEWENSSCMILFFDLNKEEFLRLLLPAISYKFSDPHLGVLGECLCVSVKDKQSNFVIWQMKEFGVDKSWTKLLNINYDKELEPRGLPLPSSFPLYMFDNGVALMLPEMFLYNHKDKTVDPLDLDDVPIFASCGVICCESLISPPCALAAVEAGESVASKQMNKENLVMKYNLEAHLYKALGKAYEKEVKAHKQMMEAHKQMVEANEQMEEANEQIAEAKTEVMKIQQKLKILKNGGDVMKIQQELKILEEEEEEEEDGDGDEGLGDRDEDEDEDEDPAVET